jgi:hypothetical protein
MYDLMRSLYARVRLLVEDLDARKDIIGDAQLEDPNCNLSLVIFWPVCIQFLFVGTLFSKRCVHN